MDTDSDEEGQTQLEIAVMLHKKNKKEEKFTGAPNGSKNEIKETTEHKNKKLPHKNTASCANEWINGDSNLSLDVQDLIKYFTFPKKGEKNQQEISKKTLRDYEKQGAIPKKKIADTLKSSQKNQTKICGRKVSSTSKPRPHEENYLQDSLRDASVNGSGRKDGMAKVLQTVNKSANLKLCSNDEREKSYSEPFFYIVPEKPSLNFIFPRGSYYVIPKAPDSNTRERIIFHPENSPDATEFNTNFKIDQKNLEISPVLKGKSPKNINNLGKGVLEPIDSHLNIGPTQIREESVVHNLEANCNSSKIFEKVLISPEKSPEALDVRKLEKTQAEGPKENEDSVSMSGLFIFEESDLDQSYFEDNPATLSNEAIADDHQKVEDPLGIANLDSKIQQTFERMSGELPDSGTSDLLNKCIEFQGNEEKVLAYIQEIQLKTRRQRLVTELQYILPDADPQFLLEEIEKISDDENAVNILTDRLLDSQSYPKISWNQWATKRKLWQTYVINFDVKNYLLKVPKPEDFAGAAGDHNKADEKLIMEFLMSRYPTASEVYLQDKFNSNYRNITNTCANLFGLQIVRLKDSTFEQANFDENFLKEICYIDHREEIHNHINIVKKNKELEATMARLDGAFLYCPLCSDEELIASEAVTCPEGDIFCKECIRRYVETKISDATYKFSCPMDNCDSFFTLSTLETFLPENIISIVVKKQQAEEISTAEVDGLEFCPKCDFAYIPSSEDKIFKCQNSSCLAETCRICHEENHVPLRCEEVERAVDLEARKKIEETMTEKLIRKCAQCGKKFVKIDGCNLIQCVCGTKTCYICARIIGGYDHFSNGGCPQYSNNEYLHVTEVREAGTQAKNEILRENPNIRILYDPTSED